jgi:hypothetical protein
MTFRGDVLPLGDARKLEKNRHRESGHPPALAISEVGIGRLWGGLGRNRRVRRLASPEVSANPSSELSMLDRSGFVPTRDLVSVYGLPA